MSGRRRRSERPAGMRVLRVWIRAGSPLDRLLQPRGPRGPRWGRYLHLFLEQHLELLQAFLAQQGIPAQPPGGTAEEAPAGRRPAFSFQSHAGSIEAELHGPSSSCRRPCFNPTLVRLRHRRKLLAHPRCRVSIPRWFD